MGGPAHDTGAPPHNPAGLLDAPLPGKVLGRRVDRLPEGSSGPGDRGRGVRGRGLSRAVLAACWGREDSGGRVWDEAALAFAELLANMRA